MLSSEFRADGASSAIKTAIPRSGFGLGNGGDLMGASLTHCRGYGNVLIDQHSVLIKQRQIRHRDIHRFRSPVSSFSSLILH